MFCHKPKFKLDGALWPYHKTWSAKSQAYIFCQLQNQTFLLRKPKHNLNRLILLCKHIAVGKIIVACVYLYTYILYMTVYVYVQQSWPLKLRCTFLRSLKWWWWWQWLRWWWWNIVAYRGNSISRENCVCAPTRSFFFLSVRAWVHMCVRGRRGH